MSERPGAARRIAILGAGREGRAALQWLRRHQPDARLTVISEQPPDAAFTASLTGAERLWVEPFRADRLAAFDLVVRSPGVSPYREPLRAARDQGVRFTTGTNLWFAAHPGARTVCVTGTKGKSTTSALLAHLLQAGGQRVRLAGNIGAPLLACDEDEVDWWVIELSSYQIADFEGQPDLAVLLNLSPEHLDWHAGMDNYVRDKLRLADRVRPGGLLVNAADPALRERFQRREGVSWFGAADGIHATDTGVQMGSRTLPVTMPESLPGRHNRVNVAAALALLRLAGGDVEAAAEAVQGFTGLPHRLQLLGERDGVRFIDDSIASAPVATVAALEALAPRPLILLVGGFDRGIDWKPYVADFMRYPPHAVIGLPDNGAAIVDRLRKAGLNCTGGLHTATGLDPAVDRAVALARPGDTVLLSPGAPSFPRFEDYRARGLAFGRAAGFSTRRQ